MISHRIKRIINKVLGKSNFDNSGKYWESRYQQGRDSGAGSYNKLAEFKAEFLNAFFQKNAIKKVIEYGCGDGNQLALLTPEQYIGFDVSQTIVDVCRKKFNGDQTKTFMLVSDYTGEKADLTLSLDVIYHLVEDEVFEAYMNQLFDSSTDYAIVYSSNAEDGTYGLTPPHVRHRVFTKWVKENRKDFELLNHIPNKYPFNGDDSTTSFADFFVYQRLK